MDKKAFFPVLPLPIKDRAEYDSPEGESKRDVNETVSRMTGMMTGLVAGATAGALAGYVLRKAAPGKLGLPMRIFDNVKRKQGKDITMGYAERMLKKTGKRPTTVPPSVYFPALGGLGGALAGAFPAEYKAKTKMEKQVGIEPQTTWDTFKRTDMVPVFGGVATGVLAGDIVDTLLNAARKNKLTQSVKWYNNYPAMTGIAAGLAVERMTEKYLENIMKKREELYNENNRRKTI